MKLRYLFYLVTITALSNSCKNESSINTKPKLFKIEVPNGFPVIKFPADNPPSIAKIKLGKKLFFEKRLSKNSSISCASCHLDKLALTDGKKLSEGIHKRVGIRNAPSLFNAAYHPYFMKDGGVPNLELQILAPLDDPNEMNLNILYGVQRLVNDTVYQNLANKAFNRNFDAFVLTRAIATYERTLLSGNSKYDLVKQNLATFTSSEKLGYQLFNSDLLKCSECHNGFNFTNYKFENNGSWFTQKDQGRYRITSNTKDKGKFKTPSLRNCTTTAPYLHNGSLKTLKEVIDQYAAGGNNTANQSKHITGFTITETEKQALIDFLKTLSDFKQ